MGKLHPIVGSLLAACTACAARSGLRTSQYVAALPVSLTALNFSLQRIPFEFRIDGVRIVDTTAAVGAVPPVVLSQQVHLTPGRHLLELLDRRTRQYHTQDFDVRPGDMTIEVRLFDDHAELKTYYRRVGSM